MFDCIGRNGIYFKNSVSKVDFFNAVASLALNLHFFDEGSFGESDVTPCVIVRMRLNTKFRSGIYRRARNGTRKLARQ